MTPEMIEKLRGHAETMGNAMRRHGLNVTSRGRGMSIDIGGRPIPVSNLSLSGSSDRTSGINIDIPWEEGLHTNINLISDGRKMTNGDLQLGYRVTTRTPSGTLIPHVPQYGAHGYGAHGRDLVNHLGQGQFGRILDDHFNKVQKNMRKIAQGYTDEDRMQLRSRRAFGGGTLAKVMHIGTSLNRITDVHTAGAPVTQEGVSTDIVPWQDR